MNIKDILRKMRLLRTAYYKKQFKDQLGRIPASVWERSQSTLRSYKNKYAGQRCVVIGNGPSLTTEDLDRLKGEITFASNRIYNLYDRTGWRPTFLCAQDHSILQTIAPDLKQAAEGVEQVFLAASGYDICKEHTQGVENIHYFPLRYIPPKKNRYRFSLEADKEVVEGLSITYSCLQLAAYMGFREIYLLGIDHNYSIEIDKNGNIVKNDKSVKNYFTGVKEMKQSNPPQVIEMTYAYLSAEPFSRNNGFRIFNATRGGRLEVFERKNFDEIF